MKRWVSLVILLAVIAAMGYLLYQVMASFLLPLFLAVVLTIIFQPLHNWVLRRCQQRRDVAAVLTTLIILATVLLPLCGVLALAVHEGLDLVRGNVVQRAEARIDRLRQKLKLNLPFEKLSIGDTQFTVQDLESLLSQLPDELPDRSEITPEQQQEIAQLGKYLAALQRQLMTVRDQVRAAPEPQPGESLDLQTVRRMLTQQGDAAFEPFQDVQQTLLQVQRYLESDPATDRSLTALPEEDLADEAAAAAGSAEQMELRRRFARIKANYDAFRLDLLGGPVWSWLRDLANPRSQQLDAWMRSAERYLSGWLPSFAGQATALLGRIAVHLAIVVLSVFYFLKDGQAMVRSLMWLSPLEDHYEEMLLVEFAGVSRAVVLATLLSALVQGLLAGPAYYLAGFQSVFMLMLLTTLLALVPFVGAAAVWLPACLWLALVESRFAAAAGLFLYGLIIISMSDNLVKPYVLAGRSKLHPLLGLLSVLGGVQALGPIGILVGPMIVAFLQALLTILNKELTAMDDSTHAVTNHPT